MANNDKHFALRMPAELHHALRARAEREGRSINAQIVHTLGRHLREVTEPAAIVAQHDPEPIECQPDRSRLEW